MRFCESLGLKQEHVAGPLQSIDTAAAVLEHAFPGTSQVAVFAELVLYGLAGKILAAVEVLESVEPVAEDERGHL